MQKSFLILLIMLCTGRLFAQEKDTIKREIRVLPDTMKVIRPDTVVVSPDTTGVNVSDSVIIKPGVITRDSVFLEADSAESVRQITRRADTVRGPRILRQFTLSKDFSEEVPLQVDTIFTMSQRYRRTDKYSPVNAMLGNYGLPFYQVSFFDRVTDPDKFLYAYYYPLMYVPETAIFMNTQVPFTELDWSIAGQRRNSEQTFRIKHSQNINRFLNFGLIYDIIFSLGQYSNQRSDDKNFTLFSSYTGERYKVYFSGGINNITSFENGGIADINELGEKSNMRDVLVNLGGASNAISSLRNKSLLLVQRYTIGSVDDNSREKTKETRKSLLSGLSGTFSHILAMEGNRRTYTDELPNSGFYDSIYIGAPTFDSLYSSYIKNTIRFDFAIGENRRFKVGGGGGIRSEAFRFNQIIPTFDTTIADTAGRGRISNALTGRLYSNVGTKFRWVANGDLYINGYRTGDFNLNGTITKSFSFRKGDADWNIEGGLSNRQPSYWMQNWGSNHFVWKGNLDKELRLNVGTSFIFPARNTKIRLNYAIIDNYTGFDTTAMPFQHSGGLSVGSLMLSKEVRLWKFHIAADIIVQKSSNIQVLDLPLVATRSAGFFEHLFRFPSTNGELNTQLGLEVTYHTNYHPYAYMPATGRFYNQDKFTAGSYPFINAFLNLKLRRTRIFIMFDHLNASETMTGHFFVPSYPMNVRMIRYGLAWTFYE